MDGADFKIYNQTPFNKEDYLYKYNAPGLRYELASNIQTGYIVWINGPFKPGNYNDIAIFRKGLKQKLEKAGEKAEADMGYKGELGTLCHPHVYIHFFIIHVYMNFYLRT